jgi:Nif-specific regulatory protein
LRLEQHAWPGNIRELGNLIERLVLLADHTLLTAEDLERFMPDAAAAAPATGTRAQGIAARSVGPEPQTAPAAPAAPLVRDYAPAHSHAVDALQAALAQAQGNQSRAAQSLGLTLRQFSYRLRKAGLR